ncbi:zinc finger and BTB domain-containing protein 40 isoform X21 [Amyelois transitella]|uniref:zinc finger and BTB domain-containing protein 40 isoform X21 n=1 Tax=Amyelois transitella TaxID=680683 RepID=UPI00298F88DA|nr:zinc finger and BTB domain-containing protein 40 isoform X21 [Amyelois transitella]
MAAKSEWRPGPTVCRCCLTEGCYKDISTEYFWMGKREVYAEMLKDTLEVTIAYSKAGGPNSNSRLICESCISRLRDATEFKRQVVECERMFMQHLDPGSSSAAIEAETEPVGKIKVEGVKLEKSNSDDDFDNRHAFGDDDDDDDDDLDNQPLTKLASKMPTKESVDLLDLLDNSKTAEKRKSSTKVKPPPPKKAKSKVEQVKVKPSGSKLTPKPEKKKKERTPNFYARQNARILFRYSTIYPFKLPENSLTCLYCDQKSEDAAVFRRHLNVDHENFYLQVSFGHTDAYIKVDCTDLICRICQEKFDKVEEVANHLYLNHNKPLDLKFDLGMQPFKFSTDQLICTLCPKKFLTLRALSRHIQSHFTNCTCENCGRSFASHNALQYHVRSSHSISGEQRICQKCKTVFDSIEAKRKHIRESTKCWRYTCGVCTERFMTTTLRNAHLKQSHGVGKKSHICTECKMEFPDMRRYSTHFRIKHTDQFVCACGRKFESKYHLERHKVTHTRIKTNVP